MVGGPPTFSTFPQCHQWFWDYAAGRIGVAEFVEWVASLSDTAEQVFVREISWAKEPGFPSHEYILLTFADISNPTHDTTLRLERDTDSWLKIFGSWLGFGSNCRDTVLIWSSSLATQHSSDRSIAHIAVTRTDIDLRHIALILQAIGQAANEYKVWSFNCWWYAGCLWRNLARWIGSNHCRFRRLRGEDQMENIAEFLAKSKQSKPVDEWDPMTFYHFQTFSHLAAVERASWDITRLKEATGYIEQLIELRVSVKFKSEFSETEGLQKTPDSSPVVDEATAESGNLDIIPSASSPPLPPHEVVHITSWGHQGSVNDITQAPAWSGPVFNDRYRIQNLSSPHPICITWLGSYLVASPRFDDQAEAIVCPPPPSDGGRYKANPIGFSFAPIRMENTMGVD
ncbi:hypothetical protein JAAARDRAFT_31175 [Jaapia argillacea MUCL 33604]|uniref:Uncharacterized protein n=1 Tax=Jaapia argillacea MUCL 33604 TaxID=933084 RepID=A0A067Q3S2_9AGAM|nr:hypothetical protein JAAARDRAFT_31175 [Jaapia argillacea MUCL 33604]